MTTKSDDDDSALGAKCSAFIDQYESLAFEETHASPLDLLLRQAQPVGAASTSSPPPSKSLYVLSVGFAFRTCLSVSGMVVLANFSLRLRYAEKDG